MPGGTIERIPDRLVWLRLVLEEGGDQLAGAAAFLIAARALYQNLGGRVQHWPWDLDHPDAGAWSTSERCLLAVARGLVDREPIEPAFAFGLSGLDPDNAAAVRAAVAVATGADWRLEYARFAVATADGRFDAWEVGLRVPIPWAWIGSLNALGEPEEVARDLISAAIGVDENGRGE